MKSLRRNLLVDLFCCPDKIKEINALAGEVDELAKILGSIIATLKGKKKF